MYSGLFRNPIALYTAIGSGYMLVLICSMVFFYINMRIKLERPIKLDDIPILVRD